MRESKKGKKRNTATTYCEQAESITSRKKKTADEESERQRASTNVSEQHRT